LVIAGKTFPECTPVAATAPPSFTATGNEPGWRLDVTDGRLTLVTDYGATRTTMPAPNVETVSGGRRYSGSGDGRTVSVTVLNELCADSMTGMPRPNTVEVVVDGTTLEGCGGDPAALLQGHPWIVQAINGTTLGEGSRVSMSFGPEGRVSGHASCNTYSGKYTLTGEALTIGQAVSSRKACLPALMTQEAAFLAVLGAVHRFEMAAAGTLVLHAAGKRTITATREKPAAK
jgi:heat shock protein HslJ/uncharacterized membrane protein